jgi:hypothetical protein
MNNGEWIMENGTPQSYGQLPSKRGAARWLKGEQLMKTFWSSEGRTKLA